MTAIESTSQRLQACTDRLQRVVKSPRAPSADSAPPLSPASSVSDAVNADIPELISCVDDLHKLVAEMQGTVHAREAMLLKENGRLLARVHETRCARDSAWS